MFDDSLDSAYQVAIPELMRRNMIGTFYVNPGKGLWRNPTAKGYSATTADKWLNQIPKTGMAYGDHTMFHADITGTDAATRTAQLDAAVGDCQKEIMLDMPGTNPRLISWGQPGVNTWTPTGAELQACLTKYNLISRPPFDFPHASYLQVITIQDILALADKAITSGSMQYLVTHGLERRPSEGDSYYGWQDFWAFNKDVFRGGLDGLKTRMDSGKLWITDHISYHKYETERKSAKIVVTTATNSLVSLTLSATNNTLYDLPLTVNTQVPSAWKAAIVTQDAMQVSVPVVSGTIQYDALPNAGAINITESPLPVVTVKATTPDALETGTAAGAFTISTTGTEAVTVNYTITGSGTAGGLFTTGTNSGRYTIAASPLVLASGSSSATVNVIPVPNTVFEGEQSVLMTITSGSNYVVGSGSSAVVTIHDRTDVPPADWYLHANQTSGDWNTQTVWWSQPTGGTAFGTFYRGTVSDRFHINNYTLRTNNVDYPPVKSFYGNTIVLDGSSSTLSLAGVMYAGTTMATNSLLAIISYGGRITPLTSNALTQNISVSGTFNNLGTTTLSSAGNVANPKCGLNLGVAVLRGTCNINLTNALGTSGTEGLIYLNMANASHYRGTINHVAGTLILTKLISSGPLISATGSAVILSSTARVARLTIGNNVIASGSYTATQLNGMGVLFSGAGAIITSLLPDGWSDLDIGAPAVSGSATYSGTTWTLYGGGTQISGTLDKFNFASMLTSGSNPAIMARLTGMQVTTGTAQAGVMLRDSTAADSAYAALTVSSKGIVTLRWRAATGTTGTSVQMGTPIVLPTWLKLVSVGGIYTGYYSADKTTWIQVGSGTANFANTPLAGLAECSGSNSLLNYSTFTDVAVGGFPQITFQPQSQTVAAGTTVVLSASATDTLPLSYQWQKNQEIVTGATTSLLTLNNVQPSDSGNYSVVISNAVAAATSNTATLTVNPPTYTISTSSWPLGSGSTSGFGTYQSGTSVTVTAIPSSGFGFATWSENGTPVSVYTGYSFTVAGNRTLVAHFQPATLATWRASCFTSGELTNDAVSGKLADPNHDGYPNLLKYALGMKPNGVNERPIKVEKASDYLTLTFRRNKAATDLTYTVEVSSDLQTWKSGPADVSPPLGMADDGYTQTLQVQDLTSASTAPRRFIRLRVDSAQ